VITVQKCVKYLNYFRHHVTLFRYNVFVFTVFIKPTAVIT